MFQITTNNGGRIRTCQLRLSQDARCYPEDTGNGRIFIFIQQFIRLQFGNIKYIQEEFNINRHDFQLYIVMLNMTFDIHIRPTHISKDIGLYYISTHRNNRNHVHMFLIKTSPNCEKYSDQGRSRNS